MRTFYGAAMLAMATLPAMAESAAPPIPRNPARVMRQRELWIPGRAPSQPKLRKLRRGRARSRRGNLK